MARVSYDNNGNVSEVSLFSNGTRYDRKAASDAIAKARSGLRGDFASQGLNSPYSSEFSPNWMQRLGEWFFGDYSARDAFYQSQDQAEMERINSLLDAQRQQDYNDPSAQAARMRAAGLNPDLTGVEGVESATSVAPDETPPDSMGDLNQDTGSPVPLASALGKMFSDPLGEISNVLGFVSMVQDMGIKQTQKTWSEVSNYLGSMPGMYNLIAGTEGEPDYGNDPLSASGYDAWRAGRLNNSFASALNHSGLSKSAKNLLKDLHSRAKYDQNGRVTSGLSLAKKKLENDIMSANATKVGIMNSPGFSVDVMEWASNRYVLLDKFLNEETQLRSRANARLSQVGLRLNSSGLVESLASAQAAGNAAAAAQARYNEEYYENLDPGLQSGSQNTGNTADIAKSQLSTYYSELEKKGEEMHTNELKRINKYKYVNPALHAILTLSENKRHSEWRANVLHTRESSMNQLMDHLAEKAIDSVIPSKN